jgi:hypothetical protein
MYFMGTDSNHMKTALLIVWLVSPEFGSNAQLTPHHCSKGKEYATPEY